MPKQTFSEMFLEVFRNVDLIDEEEKESHPWTHLSAKFIQFAADGSYVEGQFVKSALTEFFWKVYFGLDLQILGSAIVSALGVRNRQHQSWRQ